MFKSRVYNLLTNPLRLLPDFLIIGAQKAGTTSLFNYLAQHSCVLPPRGKRSKDGAIVAGNKELHYFDRQFERGIRWYRSHFRLPKYFQFSNKFITGEATPDYISHPHAPKRVAELIPQVKLIVLLRNPVDRAYSHYVHNVTGRVKETRPVKEAIFADEQMIEAELTRMLKDNEYKSSFYDRYSYLYRGIYVQQIRHWLNTFTRNQLLILRSEDLFNDPEEIYRETLQFLGLPDEQLEEYKVFNPQKSSNRVKIAPQMDADLRKKLVDYYSPHNQELYQYLGKNFGWD